MLHIQTYHNSNFPVLKYASNVPCFMQVCAALYIVGIFSKEQIINVKQCVGWKEQGSNYYDALLTHFHYKTSCVREMIVTVNEISS